jgi:hypothetical protein
VYSWGMDISVAETIRAECVPVPVVKARRFNWSG